MMRKARNQQHAEEKAEVEVLYNSKQTCQDIDRRIKRLQSELGTGVAGVEKSLGQVHDNTRDFQNLSNKIDEMIAITERMLESGQDKNREERIIRSALSRGSLSEYIASMRRLQRAHDHLSSSNLKVQQQAIGDVGELLSEGSIKLQDYFRSLLSERTQAVEPLSYITKELPFPMLSDERNSQLAAIEKVLSTQVSSPRDSPAVLIYADLRSTYLANSLQSMALASISTSKRKNPEDSYRKGTSAIGTYAQAMEGLFTAEYRNVSAIFRQDDLSLIFEATCRRPIADFAKTLRDLNVYIRANLMTDCFLAFEILDIVATTSYSISREAGDAKLPFVDASKPIRETAKNALPDLLEDQRRRVNSLPALPLDGAASSFTAETMARLQNLTTYPRAFSSILAAIGDGNWTPSSGSGNNSSSNNNNRNLDVGADGTILQSHYILDTIELHLNLLDSRAKTLHRGKGAQGVFLSNTVATIDRMIRSSDLASVLSSYSQTQNRLDAWRKRGTSTYLDAWKEPCAALFDVQYTNRPTSNRPASGSAGVPSTEIVKALSSKDKDAIKEKFKHFNASFDDCMRRHKEMMPGMEREVKSGLGREVGNMVEPLYARFWDRYEAVDRNRGKYVRYDKGGLASALAGLE